MKIDIKENTILRLINTETREVIMLENISKLKIIYAGDINRILFETKTNTYDKIMCAKHLLVVSKDIEIKEVNNIITIEFLSHTILNRWLTNITLKNVINTSNQVTKFNAQNKLNEYEYAFDIIEWKGLEKEVAIKCRECGKIITYKKGKHIYIDDESKTQIFTGYCNHII